MITEWWAGLSLIMKVLWGVTLAASLIFIIQSVMTFIGAGGDTGLDGDAGADFGGSDPGLDGSAGGLDHGSDVPDQTGFEGHSGMNLYTFRNFINFLLGFGWTAILLSDKVKSSILLILIATFVGIGLVTVVMYMFKWLSGMQQSGTINLYKSAVGCQGDVYLTIPAERSGEGKVQISINNSIREYNAITDGDAIKTGTPIKVTEVINDSTLLVEALNSLII